MVPKNNPANFQNHGLLYPLNLAGNGMIFYCPGMDNKSLTSGNELLQSSYYQPLLTVHNNNSVRSVYCFNPWTDGTYRLFPKSTSFNGGSRVMMNEFFANNMNNPNDPLDPTQVAHDRIKLLGVVFSDFSVQTIKITPKMWADAWVGPGANLGNPQLTNTLADIEAAH